MNISGIRPSDGFYDNNIKKLGAEINAPVNEKAPVEDVQSQASAYDKDIAASLTISEAGKTAAKNIAKAVTNMKNDTAIHRYQYLVKNNSADASSSDNNGLENFSL